MLTTLKVATSTLVGLTSLEGICGYDVSFPFYIIVITVVSLWKKIDLKQ